MKSTIYKIGVVLGVITILLSSCEFLELEPTSEFERGDYYQDKKQTEMAVAAVYTKMAESYKEHLSIWMSSGTDELLHNKLASTARGSDLCKYTYNAFSIDIRKVWTQSYSLISTANDVIYNLEGRDSIPELSLNDRQVMIGEVLTLRAFTYLNLVRMFEYVPLRTLPFVDIADENGDLHLESQGPEVIYNQIIKDLEAAIGMLPEEPLAYGRISKYAAHGILARAYLHYGGTRVAGGDIGTEECYEQALWNCNEIISSAKHSLLSDYEDVFLNEIQQAQDSREIIWEVNFVYTNERDLGGYIGNYNGPKVEGTSNTDPEANPHNFITASLNQLYGKSFEETPELNTDKRHNWNVIPYNINYDDGVYSFPSNISNKLRWYAGKWRRVQRLSSEDEDGVVSYGALPLETGAISRWRTSVNFPLVRYADILLMKAEIINHLYGPTIDALDAINQVRNRAEASDVQDLLVSEGKSLTQENLFQTLIDERSRELCFEGHRRFDLVRWGILLETMRNQNELIRNHPDYDSSKDEFLTYPGNAAGERHDVFPVPNDEITLNKNIKQHPLW